MKLRAVLALFIVAVTAASGRADEGIWMPSQIREMAAELDELGINLDPSEISRLDGFPLGALVQTVGCSGSFVSADGLILTNFHCAGPALSFNSTPERNLSQAGFEVVGVPYADHARFRLQLRDVDRLVRSVGDHEPTAQGVAGDEPDVDCEAPRHDGCQHVSSFSE